MSKKVLSLAYRVLLLSFLSGLFGLARATPAADLSSLLNSVQTMRANFTQIVYDNRAKPIQQSVGRMAMQRPGKFRWQVIQPIPQLIVANQSRLWIYDPDLEQVTIRSFAQAAGETPALLLSDVDRVLNKEYVVQSLQKKSSPLNWFMLQPKKSDSMFASIQLGFMNGQIKQMNLQDHLGHTTSIKFENAEINKPLSSLLFVFKAPKGVDVIDETSPR